MPRLTRATLMASALLLSACADGMPQLDFDFRGNGISNGVATAAPRPQPDANGLITYPTYQVVVARRGDTVQGVAQRIGLPAEELASYNARNTGDVLRDGEILALPRMVGRTPGGDITAIASAAIDSADGGGTASGLAVQSGAEPVRHRVTRGETAYSIARLYNVPVRSLAEWNGLGPDLAVREGQQLIIPTSGNSVAAASSPDGNLPGRSVLPPPPSASDPLPETIAAAPLPDAPDLDDDSEPEPVAAAEPEPEPQPQPAAAQSQLQRPVAGSILRGFSSSNEGIDISATAGTPVVAAESGEVAAITRDTDQIPILVIRHPGNLLTVYANIRNITVERGDSVSRGQTVAEVGPGDPPFLHFEVRRGFEAVDPEPLIR
ncbi:peptidoglycan DD-metalloendopeptidase family protein [Rhodobacterales bacterium HKCCE3408]|nr:peptidoglycan DD-metalloendopeptidase family protein [Rhodobacterales bacterium HKCCE3408]